MNDPIFTDEGPEYYAAAYKRNQQFAKSGPYTTALTPQEERSFRQWVKSKGVPFDPSEKVSDYDMRGFWKENHKDALNWKKGSHFPDTFKTPYDTTFSNESKYATKDNPNVWKGDNLVDKRTGQVIFGSKMPNIQGLPEGATVEPLDTAAAGIPAGATVEPISDTSSPPPAATPSPSPASFFKRAAQGLASGVGGQAVGNQVSTPEGREQIRQAAPGVIAAGLPIGAVIATGGASVPVQLGVAAATGFAQPYLKEGIQKLMGIPAEAVSLGDAATSAITNTIFQGFGIGAGKLLTAATKLSKVAPEMEGASEDVRTGKQIRQALRNRDTYKALGMNDQQIDAIHSTPELQKVVADNVQAAADTKTLFNKVVTLKGQQIGKDIEAGYGKYATRTTPAAPVIKSIQSSLESYGMHTPGSPVVKGLNDILATITGDTPLEVKGAEKLVPGLQLKELRGVASELNELKDSAYAAQDNVGLKMINQVRDTVEQQFETGMQAAGASPKELAATKSALADWGNFQDAIRTLNPRSARFGSDVADAMFAAKTSPDQAAYFAQMVAEADKVNPNTLQQFRDGFLHHMIDTAVKQAKDAGPIAEARAFASLRNTIGAGKEGRAFLETVFGKGSVLATPRNLEKVMGRVAMPKINREDMSFVKAIAGTLDPTHQGWMYRMIGLSLGISALGLKGGIYRNMMTNPAAAAGVLLGFTFGAPPMIRLLTSPVGEQYAKWLLKPTDKAAFNDFIKAGSAIAGAAVANQSAPSTAATGQ